MLGSEFSHEVEVTQFAVFNFLQGAGIFLFSFVQAYFDPDSLSDMTKLTLIGCGFGLLSTFVTFFFPFRKKIE